MNNKLKVILSVTIFLITFSFIGCGKDNDSNRSQTIQESIEVSVNSFKSAKLELVLTSEDSLLYKETMNVIINNTTSSYTINVKELADDLYSPSMYKESNSSGNLSLEETKQLFPSKDQFKDENISKVNRKDNEITFNIAKEKMMTVFGLKVQDLNKITSAGVAIVMKMENQKIKEYEYTYKTIDGIDVSLKCNFAY